MLQCLLATEALSTYFRNLHWKREVNHDNPLGMGGKVAQAYAGLNDDVSTTMTDGVCKKVSRFLTGRTLDSSMLLGKYFDNYKQGIRHDGKPFC